MKDDAFIDANRDNASTFVKEMYSVLARYRNSEASTIVRSLTGLDGVEVRLHTNHSRACTHSQQKT